MKMKSKTEKIIKFLLLSLLLSPGYALANWSLSENYGLPNASISLIVRQTLMWLLGIFGTLGIIGFVISGIMYLVSAGNDDMVSKAKKGMTYSIIGIVVGLSGYVVMQAIETWLGGSSNF